MLDSLGSGGLAVVESMIGGNKRVGSRFVSQAELDSARASGNRDSSKEEYDPRSLYERLQAHKQAKDASIEDKFKLSNQFRGIDDAEAEFLAAIEADRKRDELERKRNESKQLELFRLAKSASVATIDQSKIGKHETLHQNPTNAVHTKENHAMQPPKQATLPEPPTTNKKKRKPNSSALLGVVKRKPPVSPASATASAKPTAAPSSTAAQAAPKVTIANDHSDKP